ncbi:peptide-methionine (S)-S-oxide reductase MsrA [Agrilutibacter solisilvae]|uniref:Peptide methionine sulfoxide reductase MsrA n=1 Tax=Agrilutibacter solisilvae TaxID=2763317 RepID=A0A974Y1Z6_9GAMM|nr:peptide-methionine (S)-S-oxide reductase MsrA [Lysobacter solisilvae]QSX79783.1 peptide-methionine (S)-S-oxide reductase MsrA [Lysobacter solisilvae]
MLGIGAFKQRMPRPDEALVGRDEPMSLRNVHHVLRSPLRDAFVGFASVQFGMGCFWGAERRFWGLRGVESTAVGFAGGFTPNATYQEVCSGLTGHAEVVQVVYDENVLEIAELLRVFWEGHDPTQGMRQGDDVGTPYRSVIHCDTGAQYDAAVASRDAFQQRLTAAGFGPITTRIEFPAPHFYFAEEYHQQYLAKNPTGHCGQVGTGVDCPVVTAGRRL